MTEKKKKNRTPIFMTLAAVATTAIIALGVPAVLQQRALADEGLPSWYSSGGVISGDSYNNISIEDFPLDKIYDGAQLDVSLLNSNIYKGTYDGTTSQYTYNDVITAPVITHDCADNDDAKDVGTHKYTVTDGNDTYAAFNYVINPAPLTYTIESLTANDNDTVADILGKIQYSFNGFMNGDNISVLGNLSPILKLDGNEMTDLNATITAGEHTISLVFSNGAIGNYNITGANVATLTVKMQLPENNITVSTKGYDSKPYDKLTGAPENAVIRYFKADDTPLDGAPTDAGSYKVTVTAADTDAQYYGIVTKEFAILPLAVEIKADNKTATAGDEMPAFTCTATLADGMTLPENVNIYDILPTITASCAADMNKAGEYDIILTAEDSNFTFTLINAKLTVVRADGELTVTAPDKVYDSKPYDKLTGAPENAVIEYYDEEGTLLEGAPVNAGKYTVKVSVPQTDSANSVEVTKTFEITPLAVEISADNKTATVGDELPELTYTVKTALPEGVKLPEITLSCDADMSKAGEYIITISSAEDENFQLTMKPAVLIVEAKGDSDGSGGSGGSGGGRVISYGKPSREPAQPTAFRGTVKGWDNIEIAILKMSKGEEIVIELNGNYFVPQKVTDAINKINVIAYLKVSNVYIWRFDGEDMVDSATAPTLCDLRISIIKDEDALAEALYGTSGTIIETGNTNIPASLRIWFKDEHKGRTAIAYCFNDELGRYELVGKNIIGDNGRVDIEGIDKKGRYSIVLTETVYNLNDFNNDGYIDRQDIIILLKMLVNLDVDVAEGKNYDTDGNGVFNAYDASYLFSLLER